MSEKKNKPFQHPGHGTPVTRRQFLAQGFMDIYGFVMLPSAIGMIARESVARAADCTVSDLTGTLPAFLVFDMAGGGALSGNWVPRDPAGNLLADYGRLGLGRQPSVTTEFGAPMAGVQGQATSVSKILEGIVSKTTPEARAALRMGVICHRSTDDTANNQHSAVIHVAKAGYQGGLVRTPIGTGGNRTGGNTDTGLNESTLNALRIGSNNDLANALNYGPALTTLPEKMLKALARASSRLTAEQASRLADMRLGDQLAQLAQCGVDKNMQFTGPTPGIDPRQDAIFQGLYGITTTTGANNRQVVTSTIVMNVLKGNTGPGTIVIGGCDYHTGSQTAGDQKDLETGEEIGRAIQAAFALGKPLVFQVITDGAISSDDNTRNWSGDSSARGLTVFGVVSAGQSTWSKTQIGHFTAGQIAETKTTLGNDPKLVADAVFLNYLTVASRADLASKVLPMASFTTEQLQEISFFG